MPSIIGLVLQQHASFSEKSARQVSAARVWDQVFER
jgi:hypothetical protein